MVGTDDMTENRNQSEVPAPFAVYYKPSVHKMKLMAILAICAVLLLVPFLVASVQRDSLTVVVVIVAIFLFWAYLTARRIRDTRPQVVIDTSGIYVRDWNANAVPWQNIDFIAHSSSVRRGIVSALTRSRRGPYLLFKFAQQPEFVPSVQPPFAIFQKLWTEIELQEPSIMEYGLDAKATVMLRAVQDHIAHWQSTRSEDSAETTIVPARPDS